MHKNDFIQAVNRSFGSGGMFCTLTDVELGNYLLQKVKSKCTPVGHRLLTSVFSC